ncbi:MAG: IclR family transcriptional regulator [Rubrivivax sp.]|nr:IclR family transcriptional regulator [Rubrivivax sp.]
MKPQRGIQSVEVGGRLLLALAHEGRPMALKDLASAAGMAAAKAHPYLVSFGKLGLIEQDEGSGRYGLGPLAMQLGLISLQQIDPLRGATAQLPTLALAVGQTVGIAVWGNRGATIVRTEPGPLPVHVNMRHGTVMSLRGTASGKLFAAWLPRAQVRASEPGLRVDAGFERELQAIRDAGIAHAVDAAVPGVSALAAPVFDATGQMVLSLTAIGPGASFDVAPDGAPARALKACAQALSSPLGAPARAQVATVRPGLPVP